MISNSIYFAFRFHLGTLAFGSLILSLIKPVKFAFWYLKEKVYKPAYEGNKFVMFCCVSLACCVKFYELMKRIGSEEYEGLDSKNLFEDLEQNFETANRILLTVLLKSLQNKRQLNCKSYLDLNS